MYKKVLVPLDGSELAECVLLHVQILAKSGALRDIFLVQVVEPYQSSTRTDYVFEDGKIKKVVEEEQIKKIEEEYKNAAEEYLQKIAAQLKNERIQTHCQAIISKEVVETLTEFVNKNGVNLIIMATHGRSGVSRLVWGSVAEGILRSSCVPVLMVRAPGCVPGI